MEELKNMIEVCQQYQQGKYEIERFQRKLEHIFLPSEYRRTLEWDQHDAVNYLEKIRFFYPEDEQRRYAEEVADRLVAEVRKYL